MYRETNSDALICTNFDERVQNPKYIERTFEEDFGTEHDDNNDWDGYFPLDEND